MHTSRREMKCIIGRDRLKDLTSGPGIFGAHHSSCALCPRAMHGPTVSRTPSRVLSAKFRNMLFGRARDAGCIFSTSRENRPNQLPAGRKCIASSADLHHNINDNQNAKPLQMSLYTFPVEVTRVCAHPAWLLSTES